LKVVWLFLLCASLGAFAQKKEPLPAGSPGAKVFALVIGVADYVMLDKLAYTDKDALEFYLYLRKAFPADSNRISVLLNKKATRSAIAAKLYTIVEQARQGDKVFIYFSGHGDNEQLYSTDNFFLLLGNCGSRNYMQSTDYVLEKNFLDYYIKPLLDKKVKPIIICDACHAGKLAGGNTGRNRNLTGLLGSWTSEIKLLSCQPDQTSIESTKWGQGRSLFSWYLVLGLKGLADKDGNKEVSVDELKQYLRERVAAGAKDFNLEQWPSVTGDPDFPVSNISAAMKVQAQQELQQNMPSPEYRKLASKKGKTINIGGNTFILKHMSEDGKILDDLPSSIADKSLQPLYFSFVSAVKTGRLVLPDNASGYYYYTLLKPKLSDKGLVEDMKHALFTAIMKSYGDLLYDLYNNNDSIFYSNLKLYSARNMIIGLELADGIDLLTRSVKSKQLFLQAALWAAATDTAATSFPANRSIDLLQDALQADSLNTAAYILSTNLYLGQQRYDEALAACARYEQLLPNDECGYFRKGKLYLLKEQPNLAMAAFMKALALRPGYMAAQEYLDKLNK
jgi:hypothetical protein